VSQSVGAAVSETIDEVVQLRDQGWQVVVYDAENQLCVDRSVLMDQHVSKSTDLGLFLNLFGDFG